MSNPYVVSYGGGVDSMAMVIGLRDLGKRPDAVVFSDTRGEKPETYFYLRQFVAPWLDANGFPPLTTVCRADFGRSQTGDESLEAECLRLGTLPSRAYGFGTCADKWKIDPFKWWAQSWQPAIEAWARGETVTRAIGYEAGEEHRIGTASDPGYSKDFPLIQLGWDRDACEAAIRREGLPLPPKSACYYCPSSTKREIIALNEQHPDLMARALALEKRANDTGRWNVAGLGRRFAWADIVGGKWQLDLIPEAFVEPCMICEAGE